VARSFRRVGEADGSMDLLLDTICNMFGIFIFVAILLAVVSKQRVAMVVRELESREQQSASSDAVETLRGEIESLRRDKQGRDDSRALTLSKRVDEAADQRRRVRAILDERRLQLARYRDQTIPGDERLRTLKASLSLYQQEVVRLQESIRETAKLGEVTVRTPRSRKLENRIPVQVVIDRDRVYILNPWWENTKDTHPCDIWTHWHEKDVDAAGSAYVIHKCVRGGAVHIERHVLLRADGGLKADDPVALRSEQVWKDFLDWLDPDRYLVSIKVTPTGHGAFGSVRNAVVSRGVSYQVYSIQLDPLYHDEIVEGTPTGQ